MPTQFNKIMTDSDDLNRIQENIRIAVDPLSTDPLLNRKQISATINTTAVVQHNLGRFPKGWIVISKDSNANIWSVPSTWNASTITLVSSASVNATVIIF